MRKYSDKWFESATLKELREERELFRQNMCNSLHNVEFREELKRILRVFDQHIYKKENSDRKKTDFLHIVSMGVIYQMMIDIDYPP